MAVSDEMLLGLLLGIGVPFLLWALRMYGMTNRLLNLHLPPEVDEAGFGTKAISQQIADQTNIINKTHQESLSSNDALRHSIRELSHYVRWDTKERTGKAPPPYVRKG